MVATFVLLGLAFHRTYKDRQRVGRWGLGMLFGTIVISIGLVLYSAFFR